MDKPDLIDALIRHSIAFNFGKVAAHNLQQREVAFEALELIHHRDGSVIHIFFVGAEKPVGINFSKLVVCSVDLHFLVDHLEAAVCLQSLVDALGSVVVEDGLTVGLVHDKDALFELVEKLLVADTRYLRLNIEVACQRYDAVDEDYVEENVPEAVS